MVKRMLIDATHPEETRVVVMDGTRLEEFDVETSTKKQNKGNIYLAKVVRVEPSLQAAFVDYGGNRHGFLAFSEIHPDYYQIPVADRERLLAEVQQHAHDDDDHHHVDDRPVEQPDHDHHHDHDGHDHDHSHDDHSHTHDHADAGIAAVPASDLPPVDNGSADTVEAQQLSFLAPSVSSAPISETPDDDAKDEATDETVPPPAFAETADAPPPQPGDENRSDDGSIEGAASDEAFAATMSEEAPAADATAPAGDEFSERPSQVEDVPVEERPVDIVGGSEEPEDADEEEVEDEDSKRRRRFLASRHYKIQEVIKRRQIMLVQVVKEERGNKGAALTTYLSLAGRYCVLMPNSSRGGGVSRKITNATDRRRLKSIMAELQPPKTAAVILRTAGAERSKPEIKRDYEYLMRAWDVIRENTLQSRAPSLIHEEGNLIKRAIRDVYSKDIEDILVEGEDGYKTAKDFMRMLTPSHSKKVQRYGDTNISLFQRYQVESQLEAINTPVVQLRSGGSIVFGQTEALVAIDVNSGRATRERHIEETALKTNLEAADEIARQLRLRDLAGLVVIDFIDMEENRNNHAVERRLKEALKQDRARIQVGRISHFGLLELSRQRLRPSLIETNFRPCSACGGTGLIRSTESASIYTLRMIEEEGIRRRSSELTVTVHPDVALYLLNYKREQLATLEARYGLRIFVLGDSHLIQPNLRIDRVKATRAQLEEAAAHQTQQPQSLPAPEAEPEIEEDVEIEVEEEEASDESSNVENLDGNQEGGRGRGRRRRRRRGRGRERERDGRDGRDRDTRDQRDEPREQGGREGGYEQAAGVEDQPSTGDIAAEGSAHHDAGEEHAEGGEQGGRDERGGRRRRRGRRGGRRRRREGGDYQGQDARGDGVQTDGAPGEDETGSDGFQTNGVDSPAAVFDGETSDVPPATQPSEEAPASGGRRRGFFSAVKEAALSWTRNDGDGNDTPPTPAQMTQAEVPPRAPAPVAPAPVAPTPVAPAPQAAPTPPPPPPVAEEAPAGPPKKGWWSQPKE
jgi:ribonuclease E